MWRYRGTPHYLDRQGDRLGLPRTLTDRAKHNQEIYRASVLLGQLCERWHKARRQEGLPVFLPSELEQVKGTLGECEQEARKLHALAAAAAAMIDEAWLAFGLEPPARPFAVSCESDQPPVPDDPPRRADESSKHTLAKGST